MGEKKVTFMVLKVVDLQCEKCYKKVKKVLCKFPQIRDQEYDEKNNLVKIKVVCCSPEKIRDKLCCKGGGAIKSIEIKEPEKPKKDDKESKEKPKKDDKESKEKPKETGNVIITYPPPLIITYMQNCCTEWYGGHPGGPCKTGCGCGGAARYDGYDGYCAIM